MRRAPLFFATSVSALLIAGCARVPDMGARPELRAAKTLASQQSLAASVSPWPTSDWPASFGDAQLIELIAEAAAQSPDIRAAAARIAAADAIAVQAGAARLPSASIDASAGFNKQSETLGIPPQFVPDGLRDVGRIAGSFSFDLDLWGRNRASLAAATSDSQAARVDADQAKLMLTTAIASAYADLARIHRQRDVATTILGLRSSSATLTGERARVGIEPRGNLRQAQARVYSAQADIGASDEAIRLTQNRIAALIGAGPDRGLTIKRPVLSTRALGLPAAAGIDLIGRRPDIVSARLRADAAAKRIDSARAAFYPNINLTALIGLQSLGVDQLFKGASSIASFGPAISLPLFDNGALAGRYGKARADYDLAVANYDATLITALREVADAVTSRQSVELRLTPLTQALAAARDASRVASIRYRGGLSNQLAVLVAQDFEIVLERSVAELEAQRLTLDVALIRALGGGYQAAPKNAAANASPLSPLGAN